MAVKKMEKVTVKGIGEVSVFNLDNNNGMKVRILNYGGIVASVLVPDRKGDFKDVVLGCDTVHDYVRQKKYFGAITGRYANRIEDGSFELNGKRYTLAKNDGRNHLHGGVAGFDKVLWGWDIKNKGMSECLELSYQSPDGEEGYPGTLDIKVEYSLSDNNELIIDYRAITDADTIVNLSNHSYFNLLGHDGRTIAEHQLKICADRYAAIDENCLTNGELVDVEDTPFDFRRLSPIGRGLQSSDQQIVNGRGYDHNWVLRNFDGSLRKAAELYEPSSGRLMKVYTTKPGLQFYSGNFLDKAEKGKAGQRYGPRSALCLETQHFPNAMKHKHFPSPVLRVGEQYRHTTVYQFGTRC